MVDQNSSPDEKPKVTLPGTVEKIIESQHGEPEKAQISVERADELYREIRVENVLEDSEGQRLALKPGTPVEVTIAAESKDTVKKDTVKKDTAKKD